MRWYKCHYKAGSVEYLTSGGCVEDGNWWIFARPLKRYWWYRSSIWRILQSGMSCIRLWWSTSSGWPIWPDKKNLSLAKKVLDRYDLWPDLLEKVQEDWTPNEHIESKTLLAAQETQLIGFLSARPIYGVYYGQATSAGVEQEAMFAWLSDGRFLVLLKHGHHGFFLAIQRICL